MDQSLQAQLAAGGVRCEDLDRPRQDLALAALLGYELPEIQPARDFLSASHEDDLPMPQ